MEIKAAFDADYFWKNFRLGSELQISGSFIYNGLFTLENMETFHYEEECFEFLYNISIGIERLEKVAIILIEHDGSVPQETFEKSLITHNHLELLNRIKKNRQLILGKQHIKFLEILTNFYKSVRYDRFNLTSVFQPPQDQQKLIQFISEELQMEIRTGIPFPTGASDRIKTFVGNIVGRIATQLFDIIESDATRLHTFTYEMPYDSKAFKIFRIREFDFSMEKLMQREALLFILKEMPNDELKKFINSIEPLKFNNFHTNEYLKSIMNFHGNRSVVDEMEHIYEDNKIDPNRISSVRLLGSSFNFEAMKELDDSFGPIAADE